MFSLHGPISYYMGAIKWKMLFAEMFLKNEQVTLINAQ